MEYTKDELDFLEKNNFEFNYGYNLYFYNTGVLVRGDHSDGLACVFYEKDVFSNLTYYCSLLEMMIEDVTFADIEKERFDKIKDDLIEDITLWLNKINNITGTCFKVKSLFPDVKFCQEIDVNNVDFPELCEKIKRFVFLLDKSLKELNQKAIETLNWDIKYSEAIIRDD